MPQILAPEKMKKKKKKKSINQSINQIIYVGSSFSSFFLAARQEDAERLHIVESDWNAFPFAYYFENGSTGEDV